MKTKIEPIIKCCSLKGDFSDRGKHVMINGVTVCGFFTVDFDRELYKKIAADVEAHGILQEYQIEEWDITCKQCLEISDRIHQHKEYKETLN